MPRKRGGDIGACRYDQEALLARVGDQGIDQARGNPAAADFRWNNRVLGDPGVTAGVQHPGEAANRFATRDAPGIRLFPSHRAA